jgi:protein TonB
MELKKNPKLDYRKKSGLFFNIGLVLSLLFVIFAFEWKFAEEISEVGDDFVGSYDELIEIPVTEQKIEPPKPAVVPDIIEVDDTQEIEVEDIVFTFDQYEIEKIEIIDVMDGPPVEKADVIHEIVETMPSYVGGLEEFYKFVGKHLKYPAQARRMGIEGKVFVYFVVDKDGGLNDIKIARGIGAGCDEEVLRIINMSPKWNPGKQRGVPVKVRMMMPITFRLQ